MNPATACGTFRRILLALAVTTWHNLTHEEIAMASAFKRERDKKRKGARWTIVYKGADGRRVRRLAFVDREESLRWARKLEDEARALSLGAVSPAVVRLAEAGRKTLDEHAEDYRAYLSAKGGTAEHVRSSLVIIEETAEECGWTRLADIDAAKLAHRLRALTDDGRSARTVNWRRGALRSFTRWLVREGRLPADPLANAPRLNEAADRRRERRALDDAGLQKLFAAAETGPIVENVAGPDRAMLYRLAVGSGLRRGELASLTPQSFNLDAAQPVVIVEAAYSKRRRRDEQPIRPDLAEALRRFLAGRPQNERLWPNLPFAAAMLQKDLARARIPYRDDRGHVFDFHALRHVYITRLARAGVSPKVAQTLARHSTITLTMDRYAHVVLADQTAALEALPPLDGRPESKDQAALRLTGTDAAGPADGAPAGRGAHKGEHTIAHNGGGSGGLRLAQTGEDEEDGRRSGDAQNRRKNKPKHASSRRESTADTMAPLGFEPRTTPIMSRAL